MVKEYLEMEINRQNLGDFFGQILIPTEKVFQIRNGKKISKEKTFLPGYVLIEAALVGEVPHVIKGDPNVIGFLGAEKHGVPLPMRNSEVNRILDRKRTRLNSSHVRISYAVFCLNKKKYEMT